MNPLLTDLNADQRLLLETVAKPGRAGSGWPVWDYVERVLYRQADLDAAAVFSTLPRLSPPLGFPGMGYGLVWSEGALGAIPRVEDRVGLTVAGFYHLSGAQTFGDTVLRVVRALADRERVISPEPHTVASGEFTSEQFSELLAVDGKAAPSGYLELMRDVLQHEPPTLGTLFQVGETWAAPLSPRLRLFRGVQTLEDYLDRIAASQPVAPLPVPTPTAPLALPEAFGYLDVVWRQREKKPLLGRVAPSPMARLALDCWDTESFDSRLTALADVLNHLEAPPVPAQEAEGQPGPLERLRRHLIEQLPEEDRAGIQNAILLLKAAVKIRVGGQHSGAAAEAAAKFKELQMSYPPTDWGEAWNTVRIRVTGALNAIREAIQSSSP